MTIAADCTIKKPSKPENSERLCWNETCRQPLPKYARKWCVNHPYGSEYYTQHHVGYGRNAVIRAAWFAIPGNEFIYSLISECAMCHSLTDKPEVDHLVPMGGDDRGGADCRHHFGNLRVLCSDCHKEVSAVQSKARAAARKGKPQMKLEFKIGHR